MSESTARDVDFPNNWNGAAPTEIANKIFDDIMDDFEMMPANTRNDATLNEDDEDDESDWSESEEVVCINDSKEKKAEKQPPPLTRLEAHVLRSLVRALSDADAEKAEEMLAILAEHPSSIRRVLQEFKHIKEASDDLKTLKINWEQGTDQNDQRFVRLHMTRTDSQIGRVDVIIGSDGRNSAIRQNPKGASEIIPMTTGLEAVRPVEALRQLSVKQELLRQATERRQPQR